MHFYRPQRLNKGNTWMGLGVARFWQTDLLPLFHIFCKFLGSASIFVVGALHTLVHPLPHLGTGLFPLLSGVMSKDTTSEDYLNNKPDISV